jgi:hypothetical protein
MTREALSATCTIDFAEHYRATRAIVKRTAAMKLGYLFFLGSSLFLFVGTLVRGESLGSPGPAGVPMWVIILGGPVFIFVLAPLLHLLNVWQYRRMNPSVNGPQTFRVHDDGLEISGASYDTKLNWEAISRARESDEFFLLFLSTAHAVFIPKRAFPRDEDVAAVREILRTNLGAKASLP